MYWNIYALPVYLSALILLVLFFLLLRLRKTKGALLFSLVVFCFFTYAVGYGLIITSNSQESALRFLVIERLGAGLIPSFYLIFAVNFIERFNLLRKRFLPFYFFIPIAAIIFLLTNNSHSLFYSDLTFQQGPPFSDLIYKPGIWYYILQMYILIGSLLVNLVLISLFVTGSSIYRKQIGTIVIGSLLMIVLHSIFHPNMLGLFDFKINPTPYFSSISGIIIYIGLYRYDLFRFVPIVRDTLFEKMADAVVVIDKNQLLVDFNQNASIYLDINKNDIGKDAKEVIKFWSPLKCGDADISQRNFYDYKTTVYSIPAFFEINLSPFYDKNDSFQGQIIVMRDITVQKEAEKTLDSQNRLINTMLDNLPIGIFMVDAKNGKPLIANTRAKELLGRGILPDATKENLSEVYEAYIFGTNTQYPPNEMPIIRGIQGESSHINDMEVERPDGSRIQLEIFGCPVLDSSGKVFASLVGFLDISDRKKAEQLIQRQNKELNDLNATKDKFFSIIAHDLKNPINAILGFSELLKTQVEDLEKEEIIDFSSVIYNSTLQTSKLLENLLDWSRIKRGLIDFQPKEENLKELLYESIEPLLTLAKNKNIEIRIPPLNGLNIFADKQMMSSVLRNLISNAIKFTPKNGLIEIVTAINQKFIEISIKDTGIGMDREIMENLFRIDAKVNRSGTEGEPSSGLGLLLCKEFVEKHKGKLWANSEVGKGSTFSFTLPKQTQRKGLAEEEPVIDL
jgi:signal transduction histidine kinase